MFTKMEILNITFSNFYMKTDGAADENNRNTFATSVAEESK